MIKSKSFGSSKEVELRLNYWAKKWQIKNFFIQIVPLQTLGFVVFYDSRLDDLE